MATELKRRLFTVEEFHQMTTAGILREDDRVELIQGEIVQMPPIGSEHAADVTQLGTVLVLKLAGRAIVRVQNPIQLGVKTEFQPDVVVARQCPDCYRHGHPRAADILLVVEVADSSLAFDQGVKIPRYAEAGLSEVWILNVNTRVLEVYRQPRPDGYVQLLRLKPGDRVAPISFPELEIAVESLIGAVS